MVALITRDSKKQRTLTINGFVKPSGTIVASVMNDRYETYFVQVHTNGATTCKREDGEECKGHKFTGHCYHVDAVKAANLLPYEQVAAFSLFEAMADADTAMRMPEPNEYDELAPTKKQIAEVCRGCGKHDDRCLSMGRCYWVSDYAQL